MAIDASNSIVYVTAINAITTLIGVIFTGCMAYLTQRLTKKVDSVVTKGNEVKETLDNNSIKLKKMQKVGVDTHILVNSSFATQLHKAKNLARKVADLTQDPRDILIAMEALQAYEDHMARQTIIDQKDI